MSIPLSRSHASACRALTSGSRERISASRALGFMARSAATALVWSPALSHRLSSAMKSESPALACLLMSREPCAQERALPSDEGLWKD